MIQTPPASLWPCRSLSLRGVLLVALAFTTAQAQITNVTNDQATPKLGIGHDYIGTLNEIVSPSNGSLSVRINVPSPSGRGLSFPFSFDYNSNGTIVLSPQGSQGFNVTIGADSGFADEFPLSVVSSSRRLESLWKSECNSTDFLHSQ